MSNSDAIPWATPPTSLTSPVSASRMSRLTADASAPVLTRPLHSHAHD